MPATRAEARGGAVTGWASLSAIVAMGLTLVVSARYGRTPADRTWVATWAASPQSADPLTTSGPAVTGVANATVRDLVFTSVGGTRVRVRLTNQFASRPLTVGDATVGLVSSGAALLPPSVQPLTFAGRRAVTIAAGAEVESDPVNLAVPARTGLAVSLFVPLAPGPLTVHSTSVQTNFVAGGDQAGSAAADPFTPVPGGAAPWLALAEVDVAPAGGPRGLVVALGDSITDGLRSTTDADHRWPDDLAERLVAAAADRPTKAVANAGLSGNRLLADSACFGDSALHRFSRDVLAVTGVTDVIVLEGANDLLAAGSNPCSATGRPPSAAGLIGGYGYLISAAHSRGLRVIGGTLTPMGLAAGSPEEVTRQAVNRWIRAAGQFDAVADFDRAVADPGDPARLRPDFDSGDGLHPDDAGYRAMADAVDLSRL
jgi:lysophospholipase L1-like esterase